LKRNYEISPEEFDRIEQYLAGQLTMEEKTEFENQMQDPVWAEKVREVELLLVGIQEKALKDKLESFHQSVPVTGRRTPVISMVSRWMAAASVIVLVGLGIWWMTTSRNEENPVFTSFYSPDPGLPTTMGVSGEYEFDKGMVAYKSKNYKEAERIWSDLAARVPANDTLHYFLGVNYLALGKDKEAIETLKTLADTVGKPFHADANWYLGLALIRQNKPTEAKEFINRSTHPGKTELLQQLNQ